MSSDAKAFVMTTLQEVRKAFLSGLENIYSTSEILVLYRMAAEHICGLSPLQIHLNPSLEITSLQSTAFDDFLRRLIQQEPVQYILGYTWFTDVRIQVNPSVLIPRPETEELVNILIERKTKKDPIILDACTGSGCIAISLSKYLPEATVYAFDASEKAIKIAAENSSLNQAKVDFFQADILATPPSHLPMMDIIVSNPPYIPNAEASSLSPQVIDFEPNTALFVPDDDPLLYYRGLIDWSKNLLKPEGIILAEIHPPMASHLTDLFLSNEYENIEILCDLSGNKRFIFATRPL